MIDVACVIGYQDRLAVLADPGSPTPDHADLEGEQLVERKPSERRVASLEGGRIVGLLDGLPDADERRLRADVDGRYSG